MKKFFTFLMLLVMASSISAQCVVQVGSLDNVTTNNKIPFYSAHECCASEIVYTAEDLADLPVGKITKIEFAVIGGERIYPRMMMWFVNTTADEVYAVTEWHDGESYPTASMTEVYNTYNYCMWERPLDGYGSATVDNPAYLDFELCTPFDYTGGGLRIRLDYSTGMQCESEFLFVVDKTKASESDKQNCGIKFASKEDGLKEQAVIPERSFPIVRFTIDTTNVGIKDTVELKGEYREFDSLLWEGEIVFPGVDPGIRTEDGKEYYLFYNNMFPCMLTEGDPIRVKAAVSEEHDLRGVPYNKAEVLEWIDYPGKYVDEYGSQIVPLYFTDVNGNMDTIHLGINPNASHFLNPEFGESAIPEEKLDSAMQSPHFVLVKVDEEGDVYDEICKWGQHKAVVDVADNEYDAFRFAIAADRFPIRISWDKEAIATDFSYSFLTDWSLGGWFDCGGGERFGMMQQTECVFNTQEYHLYGPGSEEHDYDYPRWPNVNIPFCMVYARISGKKWTASLPSASANDNRARKYLTDGQLVIDVNGVRYDVLGKMLK